MGSLDRTRAFGSACGLAVGLTSVLTSPAQADPSVPAVLEEVVVTARKRQESLQSVPMAVFSARGDELEDRGIRQPIDLTRTVPSLGINPGSAGTVNSASIAMRAQSASDILLNVSQPVSLNQDGVNIPHPVGANGAFFDLARVEVLKGPQGTLYGRNTTGGAVNLITRAPDFDGLHGYVLGEVGAFSGRRFGGAVNLPLASDWLSARVAYLGWRRQGFGRSRITGQRLGGDRDDDLVRLSLRVAPPGPVSMDISYQWYRAERNGNLSTARYYDGNPGAAVEAAAYTNFAVNQPLIFQGLVQGNAAARNAAIAAGAAAIAPCVGAALFTSCQGTVTFDKVTTHHGVIDFRWNLDAKTTLRSVTGLHEFRNPRVFDFDAMPWQLLEVGAGVGGLQPDQGSAPRPYARFPFPRGDDQASQQITTELTLAGRTGERLDWLVGAYWAHDRGHGSQHSLLNPTLRRALSPTGTGSVVGGGTDALKVTNGSWAAFTQNDLRISRNISVTLGARYTEERLGQTLAAWTYQSASDRFFCSAGALAGLGPQVASESCAVASRAKFNGLSYLASVNIKLAPGSLLYIRTARGFRGGALQGREPDAPPVGPETVVDYEIGLKGDMFGRRLRANLVAYQTNYFDKQELALITNRLGGLTTIAQNAARARVRGLEAEISVRPTRGLSLFLNGSRVDAVYISYPRALTVNGIVDASGVSFSIPRYKVDVGGRYEFAVGPGLLSAQADYFYRTRFPESPLNPVAGAVAPLIRELLQARGLLNGRIEYRLPDHGLSLGVFATNLTNKKFQLPGAGGAVTGGIYTGVTQEPRIYGATLRYTFGRE